MSALNSLLEVAAVAGGGLGDVAAALHGGGVAAPAAATPASASAAAPDAAVPDLDSPAPPPSAHEPPPRGAASGSVEFSFGIDFGGVPGGARSPPSGGAAPYVCTDARDHVHAHDCGAPLPPACPPP